jgi:hypothetical protein
VLIVNSNRPLIRFVINSGVPVAVTAVQTGTQGNVPATITTNVGSLQMTANVLPANANQSVQWSLTPGTGGATISPTGLVTASANGTVWAKATSTQDTTIMDSILITITNQVVIVSSVVVSVQGGLPAQINLPSGTLQLQAAVLPAAANQAVRWRVVPGTGAAQIDSNGLLTASLNGAVTVRASALADTTIFGSLEVTITNQQSSVSDKFAAALNIYPNPVTQGRLVIAFEGYPWSESAELQVFDLAGRLLMQMAMTESRLEMDLGHLANGNYRLSITAADKHADRMFLVQ